MVSTTKTHKPYAYATLITRGSYLAGVVTLAYTLKKHNAAYPLVVLHTPSLSQNALRALELESLRSNLILRRCNQLLPPQDVEINLIARRFEDTWTKLRVFELFEFDAVCYLDADMAGFHNMDSIFDKLGQLPTDWLGANQSCVCNRDHDPWAPEDWHPANCAYTPLSSPTQPTDISPRTHHLINGGMFLFRPSEIMWKSMMKLFNSSPLLSNFKFPDQDFLALFFAGRWKALGWQYNALKTMKYWHPNIWRDEEVICLHYVVDKPWAARIAADGTAGYKGRDGLTHSWWYNAYSAWECERMEEFGDRCEVVSLVRTGVAPPNERIKDWVDIEQDPDMTAIGNRVQAFANSRNAIAL
ncbi:nucleotide-diphospho-sugar transferase [Hypoxylon trugodes]|uniref:nucleotide-diphospho-sugar transferase n=1 Tax=Hypoxylon trugodes TaxID=326681 RepID=UPI00219EFBA6|nr:nucleotide-diphospho-sugar transferase [Hypoxylon trugodes]KAI1384964.1 nucleotide-diphospho-sugar transferase [Hypoxylon trugodes]